ncbi:unnamed protein product [Adineta ricciae]|uniref:F-box domain-containing protein n=1 Tax=Adineta ricciae TaxID=249248 RepID=A0A815TUV0_ADIRI|nr:unnamed protein product [Adineta ricciae]
MQICEEFERDLCLGIMQLLKTTIEATNSHTNSEINSVWLIFNLMIDSSIKLPDLCWFNICQHLSVGEIAQLSSTCQTSRHMLWSRESSLWFYLI